MLGIAVDDPCWPRDLEEHILAAAIAAETPSDAAVEGAAEGRALPSAAAVHTCSEAAAPSPEAVETYSGGCGAITGGCWNIC